MLMTLISKHKKHSIRINLLIGQVLNEVDGKILFLANQYQQSIKPIIELSCELFQECMAA